MDTVPYRFIGRAIDGLLIFQDEEYPSDAPQSYPVDEVLRACASTDALFAGGKYFCVSQRHAEVRGFLYLALQR
jgi:hypothetical protein